VKPDIVVATKALRWLVCNQRPLILSELAVAIAIEPGTSRFNEENKLDDDEMILTILGSLVRQNAETAAVEVAHFSVVEYLTSANLPEGSLNRYYIDQEEGHTELLHCCLTHLSFDNSDDESVVNLGQHSFLSYAIFQWPLHAKRAEQNEKAVALTKTFLSSPESLVFRRWRDYWEAGFDQNLRVILPETHSGLYYAALFGLPRIVESFLQSRDAITAAGGIALLAAARDGNEEVIDLLINANVDPTGSTRTALGWTVLHRAVYNAHKNFVRKLLATQIDVDVQDAEGWTALHIAISEGYGDLTQLILANGANPSVQVYESGWAPLHFAAQHGMIDILKVLLEAGADVMQLTKNGSTPLQIAVLHEQPHAFGFLASQIESGASLQFPDEHQNLDAIATAFERCKEGLNENQGNDRRIPRLSTSASGTASGTSKI
jgi:ankyrin repeat protein